MRNLVVAVAVVCLFFWASALYCYDRKAFYAGSNIPTFIVQYAHRLSVCTPCIL